MTTRRFFGKLLRWTVGIVAGLLGLVVLVVVALYVPPVQDAVVGFALSKVNGKVGGLRIAVDRFRLKFPLRVEAGGVRVIEADGDTMVSVGHVATSVAPLALLRGRIDTDGIAARQVDYRLNGPDSTVFLTARVGRADIGRSSVSMRFDNIDVSAVDIDSARVSLAIRRDTVTPPPDTSRTDLPMRIRVGRARLTDVAYAMTLEGTIDSLGAAVPLALFHEASVDLARQTVHARSLRVDSVTAAYIYPSQIVALPPEPEPATDDLSVPWTVTADSLALTGRRAVYAESGARPAPGLDMRWLEASDIAIEVDSFLNRGTTVHVPLRRLAARERCGIELDASGLFHMDSLLMRASGFDIATGFSRLRLDAWMGMGDLAADPSLPLHLDADGTLGLKDAALAFPALSPALDAFPVPREATVRALVDGSSGALAVREMRLVYPGLADISATGLVGHPFDADRLSGNLRLAGRLTHANALLRGKGAEALVGARLDPSIALPELLTLKGDIDYRPGPAVTADLALQADADGSLAAKGRWSAGPESYDATLDLDAFPVDAFLPALGVGRVSASLAARGHGYNPLDRNTSMDVSADIHSIEYNRLALRDIQLQAKAGDGRLDGWLNSANAAANLSLDFIAAVTDSGYTWDATADVDRFDLRALGITADTLDGSFQLATRGRLRPRPREITGTVTVNGLDIALGQQRLRSDAVDLYADASDSITRLRLNTDDLHADLDAPCGIDTLLARLSAIGPLMSRQLRSNDVNIDSLQRALPPMSLALDMGCNNLAADYLADNSGITFDHAALSFSSRPRIDLTAGVNGFHSGSITLDSISAVAIQHGSMLVYSLQSDNRPGTLDDFAHITAKGYIGSNRLNIMLDQSNLAGRTGFRLGLNAVTADSVIRVTLGPTNPVIAYRDWTINADNHLTYNFHSKRIDALVNLDGPGSSLRIATEAPANPAHRNNDILLDIDNLRLQDWLSINPFAPPVEGSLSSRLRVNLGRDIVGTGTVSLDSFYYDHRRVGNLVADLDVTNDPVTGMLHADAAVTYDSIRAVTVHGTLNDSTARTPLNLVLDIDSLPLRIANPFLPPATATLGGALNGRMAVTGTQERPTFNGWINFDSATVDVAIMGTSLRLAPTRIPVDSGVVCFNAFDIHACNENPLTVDGTVDLRDIANASLNLSLLAENMQLLNSSRARNGAEMFGKAWVDFSATARGNMRFLRVSADATLLEGSQITYVLAGGTQQLQQMSSGNSDMVHFVSFADSADVARADSIKTSTAMLLNASLQVEQGTTLDVYLNTDGGNRVELQGYGDLDLSLTPLNAMRLTGRYTISKGYVKYTPPLMSEKYFTFVDGSFVAFNGDMLNPVLNIEAVDRIRANVTQEGENSRMVNFDVSVAVTNSLQNMHVAFNLNTDDDVTVRNELESMSADQRANQAMNLLLYGMYTGSLTNANANNIGGNALFAFLGSRLNSWVADAIPWVDISFGINQYERTYEGATSTATNYSYEVSKSLFDNRFKIVVGGNFSTDAAADENFSQNIISNISFEYLLNRAGTMYVRIFRHTGYESILEGEITKTGVGFVMKRKINSLREFFSRFGLGRKGKTAAAPAPASTASPATKPDDNAKPQ